MNTYIKTLAANIERPPRPSDKHIELPDAPGEWWFVGVVLIPNSPSNAVTVHVEQPTPLLVIETQFGLVPVHPTNYQACTLHHRIGWWYTFDTARTGGALIPRELTAWMDVQP